MFKNGEKTNHYLILGRVDDQMTNFEFLVYIFQSFDTLSIHFNQGLRTPNEGIHKTTISEKLGRCGRQNMLRPYLKIWD